MKRNCKYDILRGIGILLIVLAHVGSPEVLHQMRCFDVPLLIFISGLVIKLGSYKEETYIHYVKRRITRIVIPVWAFLVIYFIALFLLLQLGFITTFPTWDYIFKSFLFIGGISYVWIFRIFLLLTLMTPLIIRIGEGNIRSVLYVMLAIASCEIIKFKEPLYQSSSLLSFVLQDCITTVLGYSVLLLLGIIIRRMNNKQNRYLTLFVCMLFFAMIVYASFSGDNIQITPYYKYPPRLLFISYGALCSLILYNAIPNIDKDNDCLKIV